MSSTYRDAQALLVHTPPVTNRQSLSLIAGSGVSNTIQDSQIRNSPKRSNVLEEKPRPTERPTSFSPEITRIQENERGARLVAKVVRDLLDAHEFADVTALRDAIDDRCQALGLRCTDDLVHRALDLVGSNTQLLMANRRRRVIAHSVTADPPPVASNDARAILEKLGVDLSGGRFRHGAAPRKSALEPL
jgi:hypothetical protein